MTGRRELSWALGSVAALFAAAAGLGALAALLLGPGRPAADVAAAWMLQLMVGALGLAGRRRLQRLEGAGGRALRVREALRSMAGGLWFGAVLVAAQAAVNGLVMQAARLAGWEETVRRIGLAEQRSLTHLLSTAGGPWLAALVVLLVAVAPVVEETFFRGYLYRLLRGPGNVAPLPAAATSAVAFAGLHAYLVHLPALWVVGVLLALWYERHGRLSAAVGAHMGANLLTLVMVLAGGMTPGL